MEGGEGGGKKAKPFQDSSSSSQSIEQFNFRQFKRFTFKKIEAHFLGQMGFLLLARFAASPTFPNLGQNRAEKRFTFKSIKC